MGDNLWMDVARDTTPMTCRELVELVTEHLEGALSPEDAARFRKGRPAHRPELRDVAHDLDAVDDPRVARHVAAAERPAVARLGRDPHDLPRVAGDLLEGVLPRPAAAVAPVAEDHDGRAVVHRARIRGDELAGGAAEVAVLVDVDEAAGEDPLHRAAEPLLLEELRDLDDVGDEDERADLREEILQLVDEVQPEARDVAR